MVIDCDPMGPAGTGVNEIPPDGDGGPPAEPTTVAVRYGYMKHVGAFLCSPKLDLRCGRHVIIQTDRGMEMGELLPLHCIFGAGALAPETVDRYVESSGPESYRNGRGRVLRLATPDDLDEYDHLQSQARSKMDFCTDVAARHNLPMKLVECEHLFGGERIIFYFMAEGRIDFRGLVRELAREYQTRIEMRQVGARDEARLLADFETCGQECCCRAFLKTLRPVTMKMAKMQKATLDPSKVSGRCGRLKCCLRYEHIGYEELDSRLPNLGERIVSSAGGGVVVARQILTQLVQIATDDGGRVTVPAEAIGQPEPADATRTEKRRRPPRSEPSTPATDRRDEPAPRSSAPSEVSDDATRPKPEAAGAVPPDTPKRKRRRRGGRRRKRRPGQDSNGTSPPA